MTWTNAVVRGDRAIEMFPHLHSYFIHCPQSFHLLLPVRLASGQLVLQGGDQNQSKSVRPQCLPRPKRNFSNRVRVPSPMSRLNFTSECSREE